RAAARAELEAAVDARLELASADLRAGVDREQGARGDGQRDPEQLHGDVDAPRTDHEVELAGDMDADRGVRGGDELKAVDRQLAVHLEPGALLQSGGQREYPEPDRRQVLGERDLRVEDRVGQDAGL